LLNVSVNDVNYFIVHLHRVIILLIYYFTLSTIKLVNF